MLTDMTVVLLRMTGYVDQLAAEYLDPHTTPERREELHEEFSDLHTFLKEVANDFS